MLFKAQKCQLNRIAKYCFSLVSGSIIHIQMDNFLLLWPPYLNKHISTLSGLIWMKHFVLTLCQSDKCDWFQWWRKFFNYCWNSYECDSNSTDLMRCDDYFGWKTYHNFHFNAFNKMEMLHHYRNHLCEPAYTNVYVTEQILMNNVTKNSCPKLKLWWYLIRSLKMLSLREKCFCSKWNPRNRNILKTSSKSYLK